MEYDKNICPVLDVDGILSTGKQFDLEINLPEDNRNVIYGVVKDCCGEPVNNAVVKLIEVICDCGKEERRPVSHTFTDCEGEFVFGPLCPNRFYEIQIWVDRVKHCKICTKAEHNGKCLKGVKLDCKKEHCRPCKKEKEYEKYEEYEEIKCKHDKKCDDKCEDKYEDKCDKKCEDKYEDKCDKKCEDKCECKCDKKCEDKCECKCDKKMERPCRPGFRF